jgi:AAA domain
VEVYSETWSAQHKGADDALAAGAEITLTKHGETNTEYRPPTIRQLTAQHQQLRDPIIHGLLRRGETMNVIAPPKTGKSWLVNQLALKCTTGGYWHNHLVERGNVLILDNELHCETTADRIPRVARAMGMKTDDYADSLFIENMRGKHFDVKAIGKYLAQFRPRDFNLVIVDAFYRILPAGTSENDNGAMTEIYNDIDSFAAKLNCAIVLIHHTSKGNQSSKSITDTGSGAGAQSRAADSHLVLRPHSEPDVVVMEAVTRSWPSPQPTCLQWEFPLWSVAEGLDPNQLKDAKPARGQSDRPSKFDAALVKVMELLSQSPHTARALRRECHTNQNTINEIIETLFEQNKIIECKVKTSKGEYDGYTINNPL